MTTIQKLKFVPRANLLVRVPGAMQFIGQAAPYVGRSKRQMSDGSWGYPADNRPYEVPADSKECRRLFAMVNREQALWPFDEATAAACGTKFVAVEWLDGEWVPVEKPAKKKSEG